MNKGIAIYLRLSLADNDLGENNKDESNSIENQRELILNFIEKRNDLSGNITEYVDDGYTGTNFERPAFKRMLNDIKSGNIHTIVVKDLSRLGRDYIGVGDFLEQVFPSLNVRFIAINSNYDSNDYIGKTIGLDTSLGNLVNSLYSKDISKKVKSAYKTKWKHGHNTASVVPFGYIKDPENKYKWLIDKGAAKIVKTIFDEACKGHDTSAICNYLNTHKIPTAALYMKKVHGIEHQSIKGKDESQIFWVANQVWKILTRYAYTGAAVHGEMHFIVLGSRSRRKTKEEEQVIIENDHPAIISKEVYQKAQEVIHTVKTSSPRFSSGDALTGKIKCGHCGHTMSYFGTNERKIYCSYYVRTSHHAKCNNGPYPAMKIEGCVKYAIWQQLLEYNKLGDTLSAKRENESGKMDQLQRDLRRKLEQIKIDSARQYEYYATGRLTKEAYLSRKEQLKCEEECAEKKLEELTEVRRESSLLNYEINDIQSIGEDFLKDRKLTRDITNAFIDSVTLYNDNRVDIKFKFDDVLQKYPELVAELKASWDDTTEK